MRQDRAGAQLAERLPEGSLLLSTLHKLCPLLQWRGKRVADRRKVPQKTSVERDDSQESTQFGDRGRRRQVKHGPDLGRVRRNALTVNVVAQIDRAVRRKPALLSLQYQTRVSNSCSANVSEKTTTSSMWTRYVLHLNLVRTVSIIRWKDAGALHRPNGIYRN